LNKITKLNFQTNLILNDEIEKQKKSNKKSLSQPR
jgi:hypothetical protein